MKRSTLAAACGSFVFAGVLALCASQASATVVTFEANGTFSGTSPAGSPPFVTLTLNDHGAPGLVTLTVDTPGLVSSEFVGKLFLNLNPALNPGGLALSNFAPLSGSLAAPSMSLSGNNNVAGGGIFDLEFDFNTSNAGGGALRFNAGESFSIDIGGIGSLVATDFNFISEGQAGNGNQLIAVHVQGIGTGQSGWVGQVPEPTTALTGIMIGGLALLRRRSAR